MASKDLTSKQNTIENEYQKLYHHNQEQDIKLRLLETKEKIATIIGNRNYSWALENIGVALSLAPKDPTLLRMKAQCLSSLGDFSNALLVWKEALEVDPRDENSLTNCLELMLFQKDLESYASLLSKNRSLIPNKFGGKLPHYFEALELYQKGESIKLKANIEELIKAAPTEKANIMAPWSFDEFRVFCSTQPASAEKDYLLAMVDVLSGSSSRSDALKRLNLAQSTLIPLGDALTQAQQPTKYTSPESASNPSPSSSARVSCP